MILSSCVGLGKFAETPKLRGRGTWGAVYVVEWPRFLLTM